MWRHNTCPTQEERHFKSTRATTPIVAAAYTDWFIPTNRKSEYNDQSGQSVYRRYAKPRETSRRHASRNATACVAGCRTQVQRLSNNTSQQSHQKWPINIIMGATQNQVQFTQTVQQKQSITRGKTDQHDQCVQHIQCNFMCA